MADSHEHKIIDSEVSMTEEVAYVEHGSEGCEEHYNDRVVVIDKHYVGAKKPGRFSELTGLQKAVLLGDSLCCPRSKKRFGKR